MKAGTSTSATDRAGPRFLFIGGKGGVGKTTCAAAFAVAAASGGDRVLVASTDPAPSLGDALGLPLGASPRPVASARGRLAAVEIDAAKSLDRWLKPRRPVLESIAVQGTWLEQDDVAALLRLSLPGIDELAALLEISRLAETRRYDLVVVDTAPTGHTLRMLAMPETLRGIAGVFDVIREKRRVMEAALRGGWTAGAEDELILAIERTAGQLASLLRDRARTRVTWITLAEPMSIAETTDALSALGAAGIAVDEVIVNRVTPAPERHCGHCKARRRMERRAIAALRPAPSVRLLEAFDVEPTGVRTLRRVAAALLSQSARPGQLEGASQRWTARPAGRPSPPAAVLPIAARLVIFGGKGGVGKTTCAAAMALSAARHRRRPVLLISTDPAHSLGDVFGEPVSDAAAPLRDGPANLHVREIDPAALLERLRGRYLTAVDRVFDRLSGGSFDAAHDRAVMRSLIELAPPGLDELAAVLEITDAIAVEPPAWDLVIMDTAPTGHALRLLEMPALVQQWARALMAILLKYQGVARLGDLGETLLNLSKGLGRLRTLLTDRERTAFIIVTRAAALPRHESVRLAARLEKLEVHVPAVLVNGVGRGTCRRCLRAAGAERAELVKIERHLSHRGKRAIVIAGAEVPPPRGAASLRRWAATAWRASPGYHQNR